MVGTREAYWFAGWPVVVGVDGEVISKETRSYSSGSREEGWNGTSLGSS